MNAASQVRQCNVLHPEQQRTGTAKFVKLCNPRPPKRKKFLDRSYHTPMNSTNKPAPVASKRNPGTQAKILVVDDDVRLRDLLKRFLTEQGYTVTVAANSLEMNRYWIRERYDLLVLDLMLPGEDGLSICGRLRSGGDNTPIIMLTAKGEDADRISGLELGADDYLPKPFNPRELLARIAAVLRRATPDEIPGAPSEHAETYVFGEFTFDLGKRTLLKKDQPVTLTTGEYSVLKVLARHARQPLSREKLMELARGREYEVFDRSLDVQVSRLRKLIEPDPASPRFIQTVWGLGYVFIPDGQSK